MQREQQVSQIMVEQGDWVQANGHPSPRSASKRAPAPMPALAKQALSENGISPRPSANGKSSGTRKGDSAGAWSEEQDVALIQVGSHITVNMTSFMHSPAFALPEGRVWGKSTRHAAWI